MTTDDTYNGWTNRETWAFMLNVTNDQGLVESAREYVVTAAAGAEWSPICPDDTDAAAAYARMAAADALRDWADMHFTRAGYADEYGDTWPDGLADIASDIGSLWRICWDECVDALADGE